MKLLSDNETNLIIEKLLNDGVIAFPTDTVWGIGCLVENDKAIEKIYEIKNRDKSKPLILLGKSIDALRPYIKNLTNEISSIAEKHFPGAVTIISEKSELTPSSITSGFSTVGIRIPACPPLIELLNSIDSGVLATTSANISNTGSNATRQDVIDSIGSKLDFVMQDYDFTPLGIESTIVAVSDTSSDKIKILRQGAVRITT